MGFASIEVEPGLAADSDATLERARAPVGRGRTAERLREDPRHAGRPAGHRGGDRRGHQRQRHAHVLVEVYRDVARAYIAGLRRRMDARQRPASGRVGGQLLREPGGHQGRQGARRDRDASGRGGPRNGGHGQRPAGLPGLPGDLRGRRVRRPAGGRRPRPALPVGQHLDQEPRLPRRDVRRGADRSATRSTPCRARRSRPSSTTASWRAPWTPTLPAPRPRSTRSRRWASRIEQVTDELIDEGVRAFSASFDELMGTIDATRRALATA